MNKIEGWNICIDTYQDFINSESYRVITEKLKNLIALPQVQDAANVPDAVGARAYSSVHLSDQINIPKLLDFYSSDIGLWLFKSIIHAAKSFGLDNTRDISKFKFHRTWVNEMHKGCEAVVHRHSLKTWTIPHVVAIFYVDSPPNSADLVFIDDETDVMRGGRLCDYDLSNAVTVNSAAGKLVVHDSSYFHGTTVHQSVDIRRCIILEVGFPPKKL